MGPTAAATTGKTDTGAALDFQFTEEQQQFRQEVRDFLDKELPADWVDYLPATTADHVSHAENGWEVFQDIAHKLGERGWLSLFWPKEYGGQARTFVDNFIFQEELARRGSPGYNAIAARMFAPTLMKYGTPEQKEQHLMPISRGECFWCEGFSEPEAGSDMANLKTRAVKNGDHFIINGQKTWSTLASHSDGCFLLARTDPESKRHRGLTFFLLDMQTPGVTVTPTLDMLGDPHFCEIFFDDVKVPQENVVGKENEGWQVVQTLLSFERGSIEYPARVQSLAERLQQYTGVIHDDHYRETVAKMVVEAEVGRLLNYRLAWMQDEGTATEWHAAIAKLFSTDLYKHAAFKAMELLGMYGQLDKDNALAPLKGWIEQYYMISYGATLAAGTSEIQRTIIAMRGLDMPRG
jgi:alkylation response protein AidB-like acyl-CoA dehydrogenase